MSFATQMFNNAFFLTFVKKGFVVLNGIISLMLVARYFGPAMRGEYMFIVNVVIVGTTILNLGISLIYPHFRKQDKRAKNLFVSYSFLQFFLYLIISLLIMVITKNVILGISALLISVNVLNLQVTQINLVENLKQQSMIIIISSLINTSLITLAFFLTSENLYLILIIFGLKSYVSMFFSLVSLWDKDFKFTIVPVKYKKMTMLAFLPLLTSFLIAINYQADIIILKVMSVDFYHIGLYSTGVALAEYSWMIPDIFKEVMFHHNARKDDVKRMTFSIRLGFTAVVLVAVLVIAFGKPILGLLFGPDFVAAYPIVVFMFLAVPFMVYTKIIGTLFSANGGWRFYFITLLISVLLNIGLNVALIPFFHIYGSAFASVISYAFCGMTMVLWFKRKYRVPFRDVLFVRWADLQKVAPFLFRKKSSVESLVIIGDGGHSKIVQNIVRESGTYQLTEVWDDKYHEPMMREGIVYTSLDESLHGLTQMNNDVVFFVAIGDNEIRKKIARTLALAGKRFAVIIHPTAFVEATVRIDEGSLVMAGAIVQAHTTLGKHVIVNSGATVEHDISVGNFVHFAPGSVVTGGCTVADSVLIGAGSVVVPNLSIGENVVVGAGSTLTRNIESTLEYSRKKTE
ncbi:NeuD/PglB/VioB family sugar acetyltransferase [Listeria rocourtiae]|uniref:NeuD/PglB/VioB family sugar acetyltransferase n=1 Tax=Listeria rocourtiae TaxID=647910 RepID=UPI003D2F6F7F